MRKTLFLYIFKDLLKVFLLASGALAGIMSFGGLLRPLTQHNLAIGQVAQMLGYFMPAMTNYSWPIAALFATTFVYGRMSADNELTACRAAGMPYWEILIPAFALGSIVTLLSAFFLAIVVPHSFLKAEKVVYSNLARLVAGQIGRTQKINLNSPQQSVTLFARSAEALDPNPLRPDTQAVELRDVAIVTYANEKEKDQPRLPREFYQADRATAFIVMPRDADGDVMITTELENGERIPRLSGQESRQPQVVARVETSIAGPFPLQSPVRETARFMDISRLLDLRAHPEKSRRIQRNLAELATADQKTAFMKLLHESLLAGEPVALQGTESGRPVTYVIDPPQPTPGMRGGSIALGEDDTLTITAGTIDKPNVNFRCESATLGFSGRAREVMIRAVPDSDANLVYAKIEVRDATIVYKQQESSLVSREWNAAVPMPTAVAKLADRTVADYRDDASLAGLARIRRLQADFAKQYNGIESELHARVGFAFSCFALTIVGAAIGMMFKSGNFVSAFAVSVGPALVSIVLIVTGQHIAEGVPKELGKNYHDPLNTGLVVLWMGNALIVVLAMSLYAKLRKT